MWPSKSTFGILGGWVTYLPPAVSQGCTKHAESNNCINIGQNDLISLNHTIPWIFPEFHVCHIGDKITVKFHWLKTRLLLLLCLWCDYDLKAILCRPNHVIYIWTWPALVSKWSKIDKNQKLCTPFSLITFKHSTFIYYFSNLEPPKVVRFFFKNYSFTPLSPRAQIVF